MEQPAATAPWVEFRKVPAEDREASIEAGSYIAKDIDYAFITPAGSKDCVERPVKEWFDSLQQQVENGRFPAEWLRAFRSAFAAWEKNEEIPVEGTSVKNWAVASPSQVEMLLKLHIRTVEQLAASNEDVIGKLGMGGRNLVEKSKAYVQQQTSGVGKLSEENANLKGQLEAAKNTSAQLQEQMRVLQAQVSALSAAGAAPAPSTDKVDIGDLLDTAAPAAAPRKL